MRARPAELVGLYAAKYAHKLARLDLATSCSMRCPSAATGVYALECAMDELAIALELDPLELRLRCYSDRDQNADRPYSSKSLRECYRQGADAFGWDKRSPYQRLRGGGIRLVYNLRPQAIIKPDVPFYETWEEVMRQEMRTNFASAMAKAMRTRRR